MKKGIINSIISGFILLLLVGGVLGVVYIYKSSNSFTTTPSTFGFLICDNFNNENKNYFISSTSDNLLTLNKEYKVNILGIESDVNYDLKFISNPDNDFNFKNGDEILSWKNTPVKNGNLNRFFDVKDYESYFVFKCNLDYKEIILDCFSEAVIETPKNLKNLFRMEITNQKTTLNYDFSFSGNYLKLDEVNIVW